MTSGTLLGARVSKPCERRGAHPSPRSPNCIPTIALRYWGFVAFPICHIHEALEKTNPELVCISGAVVAVFKHTLCSLASLLQ